ncbi:MAG: threo-3-hydroxy-L-aspartate ammonia-lyase [Syntrophobacteraceae bacterium]
MNLDKLESQNLAVSFEDVAAAHDRIREVAHRTPIITSRMADDLAGARVYFKCENFQRAGAFKFRGAYNALSQFTPGQNAKGVITFSSGNHAQAIALAAQILSIRAVIVMPLDSPPVKLAATRGYGAEVVLYDRYKEDSEPISRKLAAEQELTLIPPYDHAHIIAGQGTAAKELFEDAGSMDMLITPLGGGGLLAGSAIAAKALHPGCTIIGVEPEAGNDGQQSLQRGEIVHIETPKTIADGAQTRHLGELTFPVLRHHVDEIVTVSDAQLVEAMSFFASRMKILVEPTGCLAAAALFSKVIPGRGRKAGVVLSGGNVDLKQFSNLVSDR